jgi:hypothetical protein
MSAEPTAIQGSPTAPSVPAAALDYLCVDDFIRDFVGAGALRTAFELRLIDLLAARGERPFAELVSATGSDPQGLAFLIDLLYGNRVVDTRGGLVSLHPAFVRALRFRELIEVKLEYAGFMAGDYNNLLTAMVANPQRFMRHARLFKLFDYGKCFDTTADNLRHTRAWMRLTSALTRHEAPVCLALHDFSHHRRMLDVGGNSGEFVLQACRRHPGLSGAVLDLPVVCQVGMEHVLGEPEAERIGFHAADLRRDDLPGGYDLVSFKSMLHDWPIEDALKFIGKAAAAVQPGGTVLIFERGPLDVRSTTPLFGALPVLMFFRSYRSPGAYMKAMQSLGLVDVRCIHLQLDTPFFVVSARKPA